ncbi:MAG: MaoC family dehydratase [Desulfatibacillaceae bacterium]|nr:MaoC family dehydratase [Desulfatibacillaceae bacterium]
MIEVLPVEKIREMLGRNLGVTDWITIDQARINAFADCTEDHQWIHVNEKMAADGPFGATIAHGFLVLSLIPKFSESIGVVPQGAYMAMNYGLNKVRFINPVKVGSRLRDTLSLTGMEEKSGNRILLTTTHTMEIEGVEKPAAIAEMLAMFFVQ